jgi:hypothetical protein
MINDELKRVEASKAALNEANKNIDTIQNGLETKFEMFLIGDPNTIPRLDEIESDPNFRGWSNPYLIDQIRIL